MNRSARSPFRWFAGVYLGLYALTVLYFFVLPQPFRRLIFTLDLPYQFDLLCYVDRYKHFGTTSFYTLEGWPFNYPAFAAVLLRPFYGHANPPPEICYLIVFTTAALVMSCLFVGAMVKRNMSASMATALAASAICSFPTLLMFYLHNAELLVWIILTVGVWAFYRRHLYTAAIFFGLATALKYYPAFLLVLFLQRNHWRKALAGAFTAFAASLISLEILGPNPKAAYLGLKSQMPRFTAFYLYRWKPNEGAMDHSLYGFVKLAADETGHLHALLRTLPVYLALVAIGVGVLYLRQIRKQPLLNQLLACMIVCVWLSPMSNDYTLVNMIPVMGVVSIYAWEVRGREVSDILIPIFVCFAFLLAPFTFATVHNWPYNGPMRSCVLGFLFLWNLRHDLEDIGAVSSTPPFLQTTTA